MSCEGSAPGWLQARLDVMPPVRAMAVQVVSVTPDRVCLRAPLAANVNDKACAFGGSIAGLMTLAGWGLLVTRAHALALPPLDVYVAHSQIRCLPPPYDAIEAHRPDERPVGNPRPNPSRARWSPQ